MPTGSIEIYGVRDTIKQLEQIDTKLKWQAIREIKAAAEPLRAEIQAAIPNEAPLSGWAHKGRTGWTKKGTKVVTKYGGRARRGKDTWPLVRVILQGAAASMYDMSGRASSGDTEQGMAFIDGLNTGGTASRAAWPAAERRLPDVQLAVSEAVRKISDQVNRNLVTRGGR